MPQTEKEILQKMVTTLFCQVWKTVDAGMGFDWVHYASGDLKPRYRRFVQISVDAKNRLHYIENAAVTTNNKATHN